MAVGVDLHAEILVHIHIQLHVGGTLNDGLWSDDLRFAGFDELDLGFYLFHKPA